MAQENPLFYRWIFHLINTHEGIDQLCLTREAIGRCWPLRTCGLSYHVRAQGRLSAKSRGKGRLFKVGPSGGQEMPWRAGRWQFCIVLHIMRDVCSKRCQGCEDLADWWPQSSWFVFPKLVLGGWLLQDNIEVDAATGQCLGLCHSG